MRAIRCHLDTPLETDRVVSLSADVRAHLTKVLRLRDGDPVTLFNGDGFDYPSRLESAGPSTIARVLMRQPAAGAEAGVAITLVQALARGEKMDWIIQKATELGVARIVPVVSQRSEVRLDVERAEKRVEHWRKVAIGACEQSGRARIPLIEQPKPLHAAIESIDDVIRLALDPDGNRRVADLGEEAGSMALAIGPEGGFDPHEIAAFERAGWQRLRLGARVLRTETAGIAAIAALLARFGEL
jgi:16S rRNA (uracil1498-N3)-methyltransferase